MNLTNPSRRCSMYKIEQERSKPLDVHANSECTGTGWPVSSLVTHTLRRSTTDLTASTVEHACKWNNGIHHQYTAWHGAGYTLDALVRTGQQFDRQRFVPKNHTPAAISSTRSVRCSAHQSPTRNAKPGLFLQLLPNVLCKQPSCKMNFAIAAVPYSTACLCRTATS